MKKNTLTDCIGCVGAGLGGCPAYGNDSLPCPDKERINSMRIGFSHNYIKLRGQTSAKLLAVTAVSREEITEAALGYDTAYHNTGEGPRLLFFPLKEEAYIRLVLLGNLGIPFTTYRKNTPENRAKYVCQEVKTFTIYVREEVKP